MNYEHATHIVSSETGALAVLDRGGARLFFGDRAHELAAPARGLAFFGEQLGLLVGDEVQRPGEERAIPLEPGARAIAFAFSGSLLVGYPQRIVRLGDRPLALDLPGAFDLQTIVADPGGFWVGGAKGMIGFRPTPEGAAIRAEWRTGAPVESMTPGPDGSLYALSDGALWRGGERVADVACRGLARQGRALVGLTENSVVDLTRYVPDAPEDLPDIQLPACES